MNEEGIVNKEKLKNEKGNRRVSIYWSYIIKIRNSFIVYYTIKKFDKEF